MLKTGTKTHPFASLCTAVEKERFEGFHSQFPYKDDSQRCHGIAPRNNLTDFRRGDISQGDDAVRLGPYSIKNFDQEIFALAIGSRAREPPLIDYFML
jgi:hypothetical protein